MLYMAMSVTADTDIRCSVGLDKHEAVRQQGITEH